MKIRFYNARVLTMADDINIENGELWVKDGLIDYVGSEKADNTEFFDREIDAKGNLLMPGFKNSHTHSAMTFLRSYADDLPLLEWLNNQVFPMEAKLKNEDIEPLVKLAIMEYLTSGVTACLDMYMFPLQMAETSVKCGFRTVLNAVVLEGVKKLEEDYNYFNNYDPLISFKLGFHAEYTSDKKTLQELGELSNALKAPMYTHNSEGRPEVYQCIERTGMTPTAYLDSFGIFNYGGGCFHCVHLTNDDMEIFKEKGISVVTNPGSNTKLASGIAPLTTIQEKGINIALGTDGPASNNCLDMFREMFLATGLQKLKLDDASAMSASNVLKMATVNGAKVMQLDNCDVLAKGKCADLIMIDLNQPNMQPINNIAKNIVYSGSKQNVKLTMVNGKILYEDGKFNIGEEPESVYEKANRIINSMR